MSWADPKTELRKTIFDNSTDKLCWRKKVLGIQNGTNKRFKTLEYRRLTDLSTATAPFGVYVNDSIVPVDSDDIVTGEFVIHTAPGVNDTIEATYYLQWFNDAELDQFIQNSVEWLSLGTDPNNIPDGLKPACLKYAAAEAYQMLATRWTFKLSESYRTEDAPDPDRSRALNEYQTVAKNYYELATTLRDQYYTRAGQALQPLHATSPGFVRDAQPRR